MKRARMGGLTIALSVALLICLAVGAGILAVRTVGAAVEQSALARSALTVRILSPRTPEAVEGAVAVMRRNSGVRSATPMDGGRAARLLETWTGAPVDPDSLPAAYLVEVRMKPDALRDQTKLELGEDLQRINVTAEILNSGPASAGAERAVRVAAWGACFAVLVLSIAVMLIARAGALARPEMAHLVADHGGGRGDVLARYGRSGAEIGFLSGLGAVALCITLGAGLYLALEPNADVAALGRGLDDRELLLLLVAPLAAAALCTLGARAGAGRAFASAERIG
jgi:cell division protein FtsX